MLPVSFITVSSHFDEGVHYVLNAATRDEDSFVSLGLCLIFSQTDINE